MALLWKSCGTPPRFCHCPVRHRSRWWRQSEPRAGKDQTGLLLLTVEGRPKQQRQPLLLLAGGDRTRGSAAVEDTTPRHW
uniref:Uncharacterized protein n=1 Tax=Arundo donax TaxID=35708 RepID=A0A0A9A692_ARUDO